VQFCLFNYLKYCHRSFVYTFTEVAVASQTVGIYLSGNSLRVYRRTMHVLPQKPSPTMTTFSLSSCSSIRVLCHDLPSTQQCSIVDIYMYTVEHKPVRLLLRPVAYCVICLTNSNVANFDIRQITWVLFSLMTAVCIIVASHT